MKQKTSKRGSVAVAARTAVLGALASGALSLWTTGAVAAGISNDQAMRIYNRVAGIPVLCIYGADESGSLCPKLDAKKFTVVKLKGGHHFDGNYAALAQQILAAASP